MKRIEQHKQGIAMLLVAVLLLGLVPGGTAFGGGADVLDQQRADIAGSVWVDESSRSQSFTPGIGGTLSTIEIHFVAGPSTARMAIYESGNLSAELGYAEVVSAPGGTWNAFSFSGQNIYLKKGKSYTMVVTSKKGFGWSLSSGGFTYKTYMIPDYSFSLEASKVVPASPTLTADGGVSQVAVTARLNDVQGNLLPIAGRSVSITTTAGTLGPVTDNGDGTYTAQLKAPTTLGTAVLSGSLDGVPLGGTSTVEFVAGAPDAAKSLFRVDAATLTADGTSRTTVTVKLRDVYGNELHVGGASVLISSTLGTVGAVTDNQNGEYTAQLTAPRMPGEATVEASLGGVPLPGKASVKFVMGVASMAKSEIYAASTKLTADGLSKAAITVKLRDAQGNALTGGGATVTLASTLGTMGAVTDNQDGTYTAQLTAPTKAGTATLSASVGGVPLAATVGIQLVAGEPSAEKSALSVGNATLAADGTSRTAVTVKLSDSYGNELAIGGASVAMTSTLGTMGAVTDNRDGTYTAQLTAPATVGTATVRASLAGVPLPGTASVQFVAGKASAAKSTVSVDTDTLMADGLSQAAITVKLRDAQGNALTEGGAAVTIASTLGTVSAVVDNRDGSYTAQLTASTTAGTATVSASVGGVPLAVTVGIRLVAGAPSAEKSIVSVGAAKLTADGTSQTAVTVKLRDAYGNDLAIGGTAVTVASTLGTVSSVTDNKDGTYTAQLTAPTTAGTATVSATMGGVPLPTTTSVQFTAGAASAAKSEISVGDAIVTANGTTLTAVTVKLRDVYGNALTGGGAAVTIASTLGTVSAVADNQDGTYMARLTAPMTVGTAVVSASVGGAPLTATVSVQFEAGAPSPEKSTVTAGVAALTADGTSQTTVTVKLKDAQGHALTRGGAALTIVATLGTISAMTDIGDGTYTAKLTASKTVGKAIVGASVAGVPLSSTASVQFLPGGVSASRSTVMASDRVVQADGSSKASIQVTIKDDNGHLLSDRQVLLQANGLHSVIDQEYGWTDENGLAVFTVSNTDAESVTYTAKDVASGLTLDQTVSITFTYNQPPNIVLQADPADTTFGSVTIGVSASVYGAFNHVATVKWAAGGQSVSYFDTEGTVVTDRFTVNKNGIYSVYVKDTAGNSNVRLIEILNIASLSSDANLSRWQLTGRGGTVNLDFDPQLASYAITVNQSVLGLNMLLVTSSVHAAVYVNGVPVSVNTPTKDYPLAEGSNTFEITVQAQDGSFKTYTLTVLRASASVPGTDPGTGPGPGPGPGTGPGSSSGGPGQPSSGSTPKSGTDDVELSGAAILRQEEDRTTSSVVQLTMDSLQKDLASLSGDKKVNLYISIQDKTDRAVLELPTEAIGLLFGKGKTLILRTQYGQYRLPLAELAGRESSWSGGKLQLVIASGSREELAGLQNAAGKGGFQLSRGPISLQAALIRSGGSKDLLSFDHYVEQIVYLEAGKEGLATTAVMWDGKGGVRPVPTTFTTIDGRQAAVIRSLTSGVYALVSSTPRSVDVQGHWAAAEISAMSRRMIVQGAAEGRFLPNAPITRAELAALLARALGLPDQEASGGFRDAAESSWYSGSLAAVKAYGIMNGFEDGTFRPDLGVTRQEAIVTVVRAMELASGDSAASQAGAQADLSAYADNSRIGSWARSAMQTAIQSGLVQGYGDTLQPQKSLTRAETAVLLYRMLLKAGLVNG